jgi:hypothetical protein
VAPFEEIPQSAASQRAAANLTAARRLFVRSVRLALAGPRRPGMGQARRGCRRTCSGEAPSSRAPKPIGAEWPAGLSRYPAHSSRPDRARPSSELLCRARAFASPPPAWADWRSVWPQLSPMPVLPYSRRVFWMGKSLQMVTIRS